MTDIEFTLPAKLMSLNDRAGHWSTTAKLTKTWRHRAELAARQLPPDNRGHGRSLIRVYLPVGDKRRRDPHNYMPTIKAIIDGLVDAGVWPDDTPEYVEVLEPRLVVTRIGKGVTPKVTVRLIPWFEV